MHSHYCLVRHPKVCSKPTSEALFGESVPASLQHRPVAIATTLIPGLDDGHRHHARCGETPGSKPHDHSLMHGQLAGWLPAWTNRHCSAQHKDTHIYSCTSHSAAENNRSPLAASGTAQCLHSPINCLERVDGCQVQSNAWNASSQGLQRKEWADGGVTHGQLTNTRLLHVCACSACCNAPFQH